MNFLGMGPMELLLIVVLALIVFGPAKLPEIMGQVGRAIRDFRRATSSISEEFNRTIQAELAETRAMLEETRQVLEETRTSIEETATMSPTGSAPRKASLFERSAEASGSQLANGHQPGTALNGVVDQTAESPEQPEVTPTPELATESEELKPEVDTPAQVGRAALVDPRDETDEIESAPTEVLPGDRGNVDKGTIESESPEYVAPASSRRSRSAPDDLAPPY